jgi:endonuclease YncB( thermonuclease family)
MAVLAAACLALIAPAADAASSRATVIKVVNGDTVRVVTGGASRTVRLLGVDAPARGECFATEAATALRRLLPRRAAVRLTTDARRGGVYVRRGGTLVNQAMLAGGFATPDRVGGLRGGSGLRAAAKRAEAAGRGLWNACQKPSNAPAGALPVAAAPVAPAPAARDLLTSALAGRVLRHFESSTGGCQFGCFQSEEALEYCSDGNFSYDLKSVAQVVLPDPLPPEQRREEGTWRVRDATVEPDGTLTGTIEVTLLRGTSIDRGQAAPGTVETQPIAITPDQTTLVGGERWLREASQRCV